MGDIVDYLRSLLALALLAIGCYLVYDLWTAGFNTITLAVALCCFCGAHFTKPARDSRDRSGLDPWDVIDLLCDIPYRAIALTLRSSFGLLKSAKKGLDMDIGI